MQQIGQTSCIVKVDGRGRDHMDDLGSAIHTNTGVNAAIPVVALLRLAHAQFTCTVYVLLDRLRGADNRGITDRAVTNLDAMSLAVIQLAVKTLRAEVMPLQTVAKPAHRHLTRHRPLTETKANQAAHCPQVIQGVFDTRVRLIEPILEKVDTQHPLKRFGRTSVARPGILQSNQRADVTPRHDVAHLAEKLQTERGLGVLLKAPALGQLIAHHLPARCSNNSEIRSSTHAEVL